MALIEGLAKYLGANVDGLDYSLTDGGNVFEEVQPQEPDLCVTLYSFGGPEPHAKFAEDQQNVQLVFRADPEDATSATALWWRVFDALHALRYETLPDADQTQLVWAIAAQASPVRIGEDENGRAEYSMNVRCEVRRVSGQRE